MGKGIDTVRWTWKNKKWVVPTAVVLGTLVYFNGGDEAIDAIERNASAAAAESGYENTDSKSATAMGGLVCRKAVVSVTDGKTVLRVTTNRAMPGNAKLEVRAHHPSVDGWADSWRNNFGDAGESSTELSTRRGPVDAAETVIALDGKEVVCPDWPVAR